MRFSLCLLASVAVASEDAASLLQSPKIEAHNNHQSAFVPIALIERAAEEGLASSPAARKELVKFAKSAEAATIVNALSPKVREVLLATDDQTLESAFAGKLSKEEKRALNAMTKAMDSAVTDMSNSMDSMTNAMPTAGLIQRAAEEGLAASPAARKELIKFAKSAEAAKIVHALSPKVREVLLATDDQTLESAFAGKLSKEEKRALNAMTKAMNSAVTDMSVATDAAVTDMNSLTNAMPTAGLIQRSTGSQASSLIAEFHSMSNERRKALAKFAAVDVDDPEALLAKWQSIPMNHRKELVELMQLANTAEVSASSMDDAAVLKGKKKKKSTASAGPASTTAAP